MNQDKVSKLSDVEKNEWDKTRSKRLKSDYKQSYGEWWDNVQPTKTNVFWISVAAIIITMIVGFAWGGWVTGSTVQKMTNDALTQRLSMICAGQFNQDPQKDQKLIELQDMRTYQRDDYVIEQGWATMPGEANPDNKVADGCAKLIVQSGQ